MEVTRFCESYFNGFNEIFQNSSKAPLGLVKILTYFTIIIPLGFAIVYGISSLCGRVKKKETLPPSDQRIQETTKKNAYQKTQS